MVSVDHLPFPMIVISLCRDIQGYKSLGRKDSMRVETKMPVLRNLLRNLEHPHIFHNFFSVS